MITIWLEKQVTIQRATTTGLYIMSECKYSELDEKLKHVSEITVNYCYGHGKRRVKQLKEMGYIHIYDIFYNTEAKHSKIRQVWKRRPL